MQYICDAPGSKTWFRIETEGEAALESDAMNHVVEKHFRQAWESAASSYRSTSSPFVEQNIGLKAHVQRVMPLFLTLRSAEETRSSQPCCRRAGGMTQRSRSSLLVLRTGIRILSMGKPFASWGSTLASASSASGAIHTEEPPRPGGKPRNCLPSHSARQWLNSCYHISREAHVLG